MGKVKYNKRLSQFIRWISRIEIWGSILILLSPFVLDLEAILTEIGNSKIGDLFGLIKPDFITYVLVLITMLFFVRRFPKTPHVLISIWLSIRIQHEVFPVITQSAFFFFLDTLFFGALLSVFLKEEKITLSQSKGGILDDQPKNANWSPELRNIANSLIGQIKATNKNSSVAIGIAGKWGSGKSSFFNLLEDNFDRIEESKDSFDVIKLSLWSSSKKEDYTDFILRAIIKDAEIAADKHIEGLFENLKSLNQFYGNGFIDFAMNFLTPKRKSFEEVKKEIGYRLQKSEKKLIIFLDDLDRLTGTEILEVYKTLRSSLDIPRTFFILGFDREYVAKSLESEGIPNSHKYIEKVCQLIIDLPKLETSTLRTELVNRATNIYKIIYPQYGDILKLWDEKNYGNGEYSAFRLLKDFRDVVRTYNSFQVSMSAAKRNVDPLTLLMLEILRNLEFKVYNFLVNNKRTVVSYIKKEYKIGDYNSMKEIVDSTANEIEKMDFNEVQKGLIRDVMIRGIDLHEIDYPFYGKIYKDEYYDNYFVFAVKENFIPVNELHEAYSANKIETTLQYTSKWRIEQRTGSLREFVDDRLNGSYLSEDVFAMQKLLLLIYELKRFGSRLDKTEEMFKRYFTYHTKQGDSIKNRSELVGRVLDVLDDNHFKAVVCGKLEDDVYQFLIDEYSTDYFDTEGLLDSQKNYYLFFYGSNKLSPYLNKFFDKNHEIGVFSLIYIRKDGGYIPNGLLQKYSFNKTDLISILSDAQTKRGKLLLSFLHKYKSHDEEWMDYDFTEFFDE